MTNSPAPDRFRRWPLTLLALALTGLLVAGYWFSPLWGPPLLTRVMTAQGFDLQQFTMQRPRWGRWQIDQATLVSDGQSARVRDLAVTYSWGDLWAGRVRQVSVRDLVIVAADEHIDNRPSPGTDQNLLNRLPDELTPATWLQELPWHTLEVESFAVELPTLAARLTGQATQRAAQLRIEARAELEEPALQRNLTLTYDEREGLSLQLLAPKDDTTVLRLQARASPDAIDLTFDSALAEEDTTPLLALLGYPSLQATTSLAMNSRLPWPIPAGFTWSDFNLHGRYEFSGRETDAAVRATSGFEKLSLTDFSGTFSLTAGTLTATVDAGAFAFSQSASTSIGRCRIADPVRLTASATDLKLSDGLGCVLTGDRGTVDLRLQGVAYHTVASGPEWAPAELNLELRYAADLDRLTPEGDVQVRLRQDTPAEITGAGTVNVETALLRPIGSAGGAVALPFTFRFWPQEDRGELHLDHEFAFTDRVLAALSDDAADELDLGRASFSYRGSLHWQPAALNAEFRGAFSELLIHPASSAGLALRPLAGSFALQLNGAALQLNGELKGTTVKLPVELRYDLERDRGTARATFAQAVTGSTLPQLFFQWPETYNLEGGQAAGELMLELAAAAPVSITSTLRLRKAAARFEDYQARGIDTDIAIDWHPDELLAGTERMQVRQIDLGFPVTDLQAAVRYETGGDQSWLQVNAVQAQVLGGTATSNGIRIDPEHPQGTFDVALHNLSVAQVLALEGEDISGTGTLDGLLPVEISSDGVRVFGGELRAQPPGGVIRLSERFAHPTGEAGLDFALVALRDFTYDVLTATVNYSPSGDLALGVRLQGRNPAVENGRLINYNVNVSENVPALLESLKADRLITDEVERRVNR